jgi:serine protease Do
MHFSTRVFFAVSFIAVATGFLFMAGVRKMTLIDNFSYTLPFLSGDDYLLPIIEGSDDLDDVFDVPLYAPVLAYEEAVINAVEKASPSVVSIVIKKDLPIFENCSFDLFGRVLCQSETEKREIGGGSGFIVSDDGMIVTNRHVVADVNADYSVITSNGEKFDAKVLARDPVQDIAIIKISGSGFIPATLGDSNSIKLGQTAIAIGNALGEFQNTVSVGVISGLARNITAGDGRSLERIEGVIQTDTAFNKGNSGGPLLNLQGEVIGVSTAVASDAQSIGFAIPINEIKRDIRSVLETGGIVVPFLGVRYRIITSEFSESQEFSVKEGVLIRGTEDGPAVIPNSPASRSGIIAEDIIIAVDGVSITKDASLAKIIQKKVVGDAVILTIIRDGDEIEISVVLDARPDL